MTTETSSVRLGDLLTGAGLLQASDLREAMLIAKQQSLPVGRVLIMSGYLTEGHLQAAVQAQSLLKDGLIDFETVIKALTMVGTEDISLDQAFERLKYKQDKGAVTNKLGELLISSEVVSQEAIESAIVQCQQIGLPLGRVLVANGALTEQMLAAALNAQVLIRDKKVTREQAIHGLRSSRDRQIPLEQSLAETGVLSLPTINTIRLGELLVAAGLLDESNLMGAVELGLVNEQPIGQVLRQLGMITEEILNAALELQSKVAGGAVAKSDAGKALAAVHSQKISVSDAILSLAPMRLRDIIPPSLPGMVAPAPQMQAMLEPTPNQVDAPSPPLPAYEPPEQQVTTQPFLAAHPQPGAAQPGLPQSAPAQTQAPQPVEAQSPPSVHAPATQTPPPVPESTPPPSPAQAPPADPQMATPFALSQTPFAEPPAQADSAALQQPASAQQQAPELPPRKPEEEILPLYQFLQLAGIIAPKDIENAIRLGSKDSEIMGRMLIYAGIMEQPLVDAAKQCNELISRSILTTEQGMIALKGCQKNNCSLNQAFNDLGWDTSYLSLFDQTATSPAARTEALPSGDNTWTQPGSESQSTAPAPLFTTPQPFHASGPPGVTNAVDPAKTQDAAVYEASDTDDTISLPQGSDQGQNQGQDQEPGQPQDGAETDSQTDDQDKPKKRLMDFMPKAGQQG